MATHTAQDDHSDFESHRSNYDTFIRISVAGALHIAYVLVALCSFAFGHTLNVFIGFAGLIVGTIAVLIDYRSGSHRWLLTIGLLVIFGLITAVNVS